MIQVQFRIKQTPTGYTIEHDSFRREDATKGEVTIAEILESRHIKDVKGICKQAGVKVRMRMIK